MRGHVPWVWLAAAGMVLFALVLFVMTVGFGTAQHGDLCPAALAKTAGSSPAISSRRRERTPGMARIAADRAAGIGPSRRPGRVLEALAAGGHRGAVSSAACVRDALLGGAGRPGARYRHRHPGAARGGRRGSRKARHQGGADRARAWHRDRGDARRGISRSPPCAAMSRLSAAMPASPSTPIGRPTRRGATSRSTRSFSTPTAHLRPVGGLADLAARRVRFVGDPATRIAEDVLRLLRYYRFRGAVRQRRRRRRGARRLPRRVPLLPKLSAERVAQELIRLLTSPDPIRALQMMAEDRVLAAVLPEACRLRPPRRPRRSSRSSPNPTRCAAWQRWSRSMRRAPRRWPSGCASRMPGASGSRAGAALAARSRRRCGSAAPRALSARRRALPRSRPAGRRRRAAGAERLTSLLTLAARLDAADLPALRPRRDRARHPARPTRRRSCSARCGAGGKQGDFVADRAACLEELQQRGRCPEALW